MSKPIYFLCLHKQFESRLLGFALLELLVALAIFSMIAITAYSGLNMLIRTQQQAQQSAQNLRELQLTVWIIERDITHAIARTSRDQNGVQQSAILGSPHQLTLSTINTLQAQSLQQVRVHYSLQGRILQRSMNHAIDQALQNTWQTRDLLPYVQNLTWRYLATDNTWHDHWPPPQMTPETLPRAIELSIQTEKNGLIKRIMALPIDFPATQVTP